ncbi:glycosyltransferase family 2 protein [Marinobacter sp. VGCF2001]|uniref:glycosyltransferase family 2 protein n=1 Tax=Marinobacter sp. VGCF2001 TaxID=3417189 RepID=UPI003CEB3836
MLESEFSVAVVIPAYNVESYIGEAIESVLNQPLKPDEIIIVNDGSTDGTRRVIEKYESNPLVSVIDKENQGLGPARNTGLEASSSRYVYFFDSDDVMAENFMEVIFKVVSDYESPDLIVFSGHAFFDGGQDVGFTPLDYKRKVEACYETGPQLCRELMLNGSLFASACLYVSKRSVWLNSGLRFKPIVHEDEEVLLPLCFSVNRCCSITEVLFHRRVRAGSIMTERVTKRNVQGMVQVLTTLLCIREEKSNLVQPNIDLWRTRVQTMLLGTFAKSILSGLFFPNATMLKAFYKAFSLKLVFQVLWVYAVFSFKWIRGGKS